MNREQKVKALQEVLAGTRIEKVLPIIDIILIESEEGTWLWDYSQGPMNEHQLSECLDKWRKNHPDKYIRTTRFQKEQYDTIVAKLEAEY